MNFKPKKVISSVQTAVIKHNQITNAIDKGETVFIEFDSEKMVIGSNCSVMSGGLTGWEV